ncbi:MAG: hypothetical protein AB2L11_00580 [Syntrophobacteraceae bacterium]
MTMTRTIAASILLAFSLVGCSTVPPKKPKSEMQLVDANIALDKLHESIAKFYEKLEAVHQDTLSLYQQPGWPEMREIIQRSSSSDNPEDEAVTALEAADENDEWSRNWGLPWESLFSRYLSLVQRCNAMEIRRFILLSELRGVQSRFLAVALELSELNEFKAITAVVDTLGKSADELETYAPNALGLYDMSP